MFQLIREFFGDLRNYREDKKWMYFEFFLRQPLGIFFAIFLFIRECLQLEDRMGFAHAAGSAISILVCILLMLVVLVRKKYSLKWWYVLLIFQIVSILLGVELAGRNLVICMVVCAVFGAFLLKYYSNRYDFFQYDYYRKVLKEESAIAVEKAVSQAEGKEEKKTDGRGKLLKRAGVIIGTEIVLLAVAAAVSVGIQHWIEEPAKFLTYISAKEDQWTTDQAVNVAERWSRAVSEKDTEEIESVLEEMLVCQETEAEGIFHIKQICSVAGIDREKCLAILAQLDPKTQGEAYYSLARIGHYSSTKSGKNKELKVEVKEKEDGYSVIIIHGGSKEVIPMLDMNERITDEEKETLRQMDFSEEEIAELLSGVYTEKDITFVKALAGADTIEEYQEVFAADIDGLSACTQNALYGYLYQLLEKGVSYSADFTITRQEFDQLQCVINGILGTGAGSGRYLRVLADMGQCHMEQAAEEMCAGYQDKETVIRLLPEHSIHV